LVDKKGAIRLVRTPKLTAEDTRIEQVTEVRIGADGSSRCVRSVTSYGLAALGQRDNFLEGPSGERRRQVSGGLLDSNSRSRLVELTINDATLREFDRPTTVKLTYDIQSQFTGSPDREGNLSDPKVWGRLLAYNLDYDRGVAMKFYGPFVLEHRYL